MDIVIDVNQKIDEQAILSRLVVYSKEKNETLKPISISKELADKLLLCREKRRSMRLEQIFTSVLDKYPDGVTIKDIDVLFNPYYKVDVLKILIAARKRKRYSVIWPGRYEDGKLIYAEEGYPDYKVYEIANYDITCVR